MRPINSPPTSRRIGLTMSLVLLGGAACNNAASDDEDITTKQGALTPSTAPELDPTTIPRFQTNFQRFYSYVPTRNAAGQNEYTVQINTFTTQQLPPGFPQTTLFGYGGNVLTDPSGNPSLDGTGQIAFKRTSPGPKFEQTKGVPALDPLSQRARGRSHPLAVDPTLDWANPNNFPKPSPPFAPFPPGYPQAQSPITHTTHTHGIEVVPAFDGTPDTWFTAGGIRGPEYVSNDYTQPNSNQSAAFWYHDHAFGVTRLDVGMGLSGYSILRDPANDARPAGELRHPRDGGRLPVEAAVGRRAGEQHEPHPGHVLGVADEPGHHRAAERSVRADGDAAGEHHDRPLHPDGRGDGQRVHVRRLPEQGVDPLHIGNVSLSGRTQNAFNTLTFNQVPVEPDRQLVRRLPPDREAAGRLARGTYLLDNIRGPANVPATPLPSREFEVPTIVQSRSFRTDGEVFYPLAGGHRPVRRSAPTRTSTRTGC